MISTISAVTGYTSFHPPAAAKAAAGMSNVGDAYGKRYGIKPLARCDGSHPRTTRPRCDLRVVGVYRALKAAPYNFTAAQTQAIFSAGLFTFALVMIFAGIQMRKYGPRPLAVASGVVLFGKDSLKTAGLTPEYAAAAAGTAMAWYAIFNGLGRISWGKICDSIGPRLSIFIMSLIQGFLMLTLFKMGTSPLLLALYASAIGFNFGANFALMPTGCAVVFGTKNIGSNYPFLFTAYGIAGIAGPMIGGFVRDTTGTFLWAFIPAGIVCLLGSMLALSLKVPRLHA